MRIPLVFLAPPEFKACADSLSSFVGCAALLPPILKALYWINFGRSNCLIFVGVIH